MIKVIDVTENSIAYELGIHKHDTLVSINGHAIHDRLDYRFYSAEAMIEMVVRKEHASVIFEIEKDADEDIGLTLEDMKLKSCGNNCVFCFVHQNPKGMRKALYFKDEDYRYSFMYGHYVTLTTLKESDLQRIVEQRLSPLYISVHATEKETRKLLLGIKRDDRLLEKIDYLTSNKIELHAQIVLCPGINDGAIFNKTVDDLKKYYPHIRSVAVVPLGLTRFRENLLPLKTHTTQQLKQEIDNTDKMRKSLKRELGDAFIYISDEFFIKANIPLPQADYYDAFYQIENGVGEFREMIDSFRNSYTQINEGLTYEVHITWVTGVLAATLLEEYIIDPLRKNSKITVDLVAVVNRFYGETIQISGLLTGQDIYEQLKKQQLGDIVLLPPRVLNEDKLFLDNWTVDELSEKLKKPCYVFTEPLEQLGDVIKSVLKV